MIPPPEMERHHGPQETTEPRVRTLREVEPPTNRPFRPALQLIQTTLDGGRTMLGGRFFAEGNSENSGSGLTHNPVAKSASGVTLCLRVVLAGTES